MKRNKRLGLLVAAIVLFGGFEAYAKKKIKRVRSKGLTPTQMVAKAEKHTRGDSFKGHLKMIINKGGSTRTLEMKSWQLGEDLSLVRVLSPAKDKGSGTLRKDLELWQYLPRIDRIVKIPPSMMLQSWMGSDFSNDDLLKSSSLARDYTHKLLAKEKAYGIPSYKIECIPKKQSKIFWGKVLIWVRQKDQSPVKQEFYTSKNKLVKTFEGVKHKRFGKRVIPTVVTMRPAGRKGRSTTLEYIEVVFDKDVSKSIFTKRRLRSEMD